MQTLPIVPSLHAYVCPRKSRTYFTNGLLLGCRHAWNERMKKKIDRESTQNKNPTLGSARYAGQRGGAPPHIFNAILISAPPPLCLALMCDVSRVWRGAAAHSLPPHAACCAVHITRCFLFGPITCDGPHTRFRLLRLFVYYTYTYIYMLHIRCGAARLEQAQSVGGRICAAAGTHWNEKR